MSIYWLFILWYCDPWRVFFNILAITPTLNLPMLYDHLTCTLSLKNLSWNVSVATSYMFVSILKCFHFTMDLWVVTELIQFSGPLIRNFRSKKRQYLSLMGLQSSSNCADGIFELVLPIDQSACHFAEPATHMWAAPYMPKGGEGRQRMPWLVVFSLLVINTNKPSLRALIHSLHCGLSHGNEQRLVLESPCCPLWVSLVWSFDFH